MHIFRCRLIDFSRCLKLKAAFRQLRTFGEVLIFLNSSTYIQFYQRAMQQPELRSHPKTVLYSISKTGEISCALVYSPNAQKSQRWVRLKIISESFSVSSTWVTGTQLFIQLLPPRWCTSRKLEAGDETGLKHKRSKKEGSLSGIFTAAQMQLPHSGQFNIVT